MIFAGQQYLKPLYFFQGPFSSKAIGKCLKFIAVRWYEASPWSVFLNLQIHNEINGLMDHCALMINNNKVQGCDNRCVILDSHKHLILFFLFPPTQGKGQISKRSRWLLWIIIILFSTYPEINSECHHPFSLRREANFIILIPERKQSQEL